MSIYGSPSVFYLSGGRSLLAALPGGMSHKIGALHDQNTGIGDSAGILKTKPSGVAAIELVQTGAFFETSAMHDIFKDVADSVQEVADVVCVGFAGDTLGNPFTGFEGVYKVEYEPVCEMGKLTKANTKYAFNGAIDLGVILHPLAARTSDGDGTTVDQTAGSSNGGVGYLQVSAFSGFSQIVVKIQDSPDDSNWSDLITFTTVTTAPVALRATVAGSVDRYVRAIWDVTGTGSSTFFAGFKRNP